MLWYCMVELREWKLVFGGVYGCMVDIEKWKLVFGGVKVLDDEITRVKVSV